MFCKHKQNKQSRLPFSCSKSLLKVTKQKNRSHIPYLPKLWETQLKTTIKFCIICIHGLNPISGIFANRPLNDIFDMKKNVYCIPAEGR